jgi:hypothetical protein
VPDGRRRLADGLVIDAAVVARLLGVRLLRIEAAVAVSPARIDPPPAVAHAVRPVPIARPIGTGLAQARGYHDDGAVSLAASRAGATTALGRPHADVPAGPPAMSEAR